MSPVTGDDRRLSLPTGPRPRRRGYRNHGRLVIVHQGQLQASFRRDYDRSLSLHHGS